MVEVEGGYYYGKLTNIIELQYFRGYKIVLFQCDWVENRLYRGLKKDKYGFPLGHWYTQNSFSSSSSSRSQSLQSQPTIHEPTLHQSSSSNSLLNQDHDLLSKVEINLADQYEQNLLSERRFCIPQGESVDNVLSAMFSVKRRTVKYRLKHGLYQQAANKLNEANGINGLMHKRTIIQMMSFWQPWIYLNHQKTSLNTNGECIKVILESR
uniref:DUF4216 domain-containing protein n=1 Tax=Tanacetum cinerariifolium TaxID=118510 RepID=A0A6L2MSK0_TANCI|nr:hypothetical protein [Tanacetum cinerariifolium]